LIQKCCADLETSPCADFEFLLRAALFSAALPIAARYYQQAADRADAAYQPKPGQQRKDRVRRRVQGVFGCLEIERDYYYCPETGEGHYPADAALGLEGAYTPALAQLICLEGAEESSFAKAEEHLRLVGGIEVESRQVQRVVQQIGPEAQQWHQKEAQPESCSAAVLYVAADATGVPMRKEELVGRKGRQPDGSAKTRMMYLGAVFTQKRCDEAGLPLRDHDSTSYLASFQPAADFGILLRREARRRGSGTAKEIVLLIDGASALEKLGAVNFPGCTQIVDLYHACEHLSLVFHALWGEQYKQHREYKKLRRRWTKLLLRDGVEKMIAQARQRHQREPAAGDLEKALHYFTANLTRMQYGTFRTKGYFIGSGVVEAGCKCVIGARCKQSGMRWREAGAQNVLALRTIRRSRRWETFWKHRANAHAATNDALAFAS
jgi:hypothetical protein